MNVPWFMLSPSPVSLIQYAALTWIMWGYTSKSVKYPKHGRILSLLDAFFVVAFFVCITDAFWVVLTIVKWLPLHPGSALQIFSSLGRDVVSALLFGLLICDHFKSGKLNFIPSSLFWLGVCAAAQSIWFFLAPSPVFTDYVYGWRHGAEAGIIMGSWILSHFIMRIPLWLAIIKTRREIFS